VDGQWIFPNKSFTAINLEEIQLFLFHGTMKMSSVPPFHSISLYQSNNERSMESLARYFELTRCLHQGLVPREAQSFWRAHLDQSHCREHCWKNVIKLEKNLGTPPPLSLSLSHTHTHTHLLSAYLLHSFQFKSWPFGLKFQAFIHISNHYFYI
jgi:hypothetical protein